MNYIYRNDTQQTIFYQNEFCLPHEQIETTCPIPDNLGLTCIQLGVPPDPVLFHDDIIIPPNGQTEVLLDAPAISHNVALSVLCMSQDSGVLCRFGSDTNRPVPIDVRGFIHVLSWELCSRIVFLNPTDYDTHISVSAVEVIS